MPSESVAEAPAAPKARRPRWSGDWPIPASINLPGVRVQVKVVPAEECAKAGVRFGYWIYDAKAQVARIRINAAQSLPVQRYTLIHELQHVMVDLLDVLVENFLEDVHPGVIGDALRAEAEALPTGGSC